MNLWERIKTIVDPRNFPNLDGLGIAEDPEPDRTAYREVVCDGIGGDEDDWDDDTPCNWSGVAPIEFWDATEEAGWVCAYGHENNARWTAAS